jgi:hypothetical protein
VSYLFVSAFLSGVIGGARSQLGQSLSLQLRHAVISEVHTAYFHRRVPYAMNVLRDGPVSMQVDTIDQRAQQVGIGLKLEVLSALTVVFSKPMSLCSHLFLSLSAWALTNRTSRR